MRGLILIIIGLFIFSPCAKAQRSSESLLRSAVENGKKYRFISYTAVTVNKNVFSDKDTSVNQINETIGRNEFGKIVVQNTITADHMGHALFRQMLIHDTLFTLDLKDSIYSFQAHPKAVGGIIADYLDKLKYVLSKKASMVQQRPDTVIDLDHCYGFFVKSYDTLENKDHNFTHLYFYLDKKTLLPVYTKEIGEGSLSKGGYSLGRVRVFNERHFKDFKFNRVPNPSVFKFDKNGFGLENKHMLEIGSKVPLIQVSDLKGQKLSPEEFKNKVLLIEFGSTTCGANPLAIPMLNRLILKYKTSEIGVISIYSDETEKQIKEYVEANSIKFPIYKGNSRLRKNFKTVGTPNFYLIDKNGVVVNTFDGYSDKLEQDLTMNIEKLKKM